MVKALIVAAWATSVAVAGFAGFMLGIGSVDKPLAVRDRTAEAASPVRLSSAPVQSGALDLTFGFPDEIADKWESANPMSWAALMAETPQEVVTMRCCASLDDYFNFEFADSQDSMWSISIHDLHGRYRVHGYVEKDQPFGKLLREKLADGKLHQATLSLRYLPFGRSSVMLITGVADIDVTWR